MKTKTRFHKLTAWLLTLAMLMTFMPSFTLTVSAAEAYDLWVGGEQFTSEKLEILDGNGGKATYDASTNTLTLNNYTFSGDGYDLYNEEEYAAIYYGGTDMLNLVLEGNSTVTQHSATEIEDSFGIYSEGSITVSGDGSLTLNSGSANYESCGLYVKGDDVIVLSGNLTATGGTANNYSEGLEAYGSIDISGGTVETKGGSADESVGLYVGVDVNVSGGSIIATGGTATGSDSMSYGVYTESGITILDGSLNAIGGDAGIESYGVWAKNDIAVSGGTVEGTSGTAIASIGVYSRTGNLTISDNGSLKATGGTAIGSYGMSYGVYADSGITILGGSLNAIGGDAGMESYGVYNEFSDITISGGETIAQGKTKAFYSKPIVDSAFTNAAIWCGSNEASARDERPISDLEYFSIWKYIKIAEGTPTANYTVEIFTMDTTGAYGEPERETETAKTDSTISVTPEAKTGFTVDTDASILSGTLAADGSTVLKIYYIRNQYNLMTIVDGVEDTKTYYYDETVETPAAPTKTGYTFDDWSETIPATMPARDLTVTAQWTANTNTPYVVKHWVQTLDAAKVENNTANETNYTLYKTENHTGTTDASVNKTIVITGFKFPEESVKTFTISADGTTVHNYYYTRNKYTITINTDAGIETSSGAKQYYYDEMVSISATLKSGYKWTEWIASENGYGSENIAYSFNMPATALVLTPKTTSKDEVSINTDVQSSYVYDKTPKTFEIKGTSLTDDSFTISYKQGETPVTNPTNAGTYDVIITRPEDDTYKAYSKTITGGLIIKKKIVDTPIIPIKLYNGSLQTADVENTDLYEVTKNEGGIEAGDYDVVLKLKDSDNYMWGIIGLGETITLDFNIVPVTHNSWTTNPSISGWTYGDEANEPSYAAKIGQVVVEYKEASEEDSAYTTTVPEYAGNYKVRFTVEETPNYGGLSKIIDLTIAKATPLYTTPTNLTATYGQTLADVQGLTNGFTFMDEDTTSVGNAGNNTFKLKFTPADTNNYNVVENIDVTVAVAQKEIGIEWGNTEFTYDKTEQKPTAAATGLVTGDSCTITVTGGQTSAGNGYVATAQSLSNANYKLPASNTTTFNIAQKPVAITGVIIENTKVYDRETTAAITDYGTVSNVIAGDDVTVNTASASATYNDKNVGDGKSVTFTGFAITGDDAANYVLSAQPENQSANITPKPVTITGVTVAATKTYDDNTTASIENNGSVDGVISGDTVDVNSEGSTAAYADTNVGNDKAVTFTGFAITGADASNYELSAQPASTTADITAKDIAGAEITLGESLIYNGNAQPQTIASAIVDGLTITYDVSGNVNTDAGDYTLTITGNGNFEGTAQKVYTIAKADATLGTAPTAITPLTYNAAEQTLVSTGENVVGGTLMYKLGEGVYSAELPKATNAGTYTVYYKVVGDNNHNDVTEQSFTVTIAEKVVSPVVVLTAPIPNQTPQTSIETNEYTAIITWSPAVTDKFAYSTDYTATVTITPKANYTLTGITENEYTIEGATVTNSADSGTVTAVFPKTSSRPSGGGGGVTRYTVKFDTDGGSTVSNTTVTRNAKVTEPTAPEKNGYTFMGWFTDETLTEAYDFDTKVTKNIILYAKWEKHDDETDEPDNTGSHNCPSKEFDDLDVNAWYHLDTDYVIENGIFKGVSENEFAPNANLTRAMLVTVLYRVEGEPEMKDAQWFEDVEKGQWYSDAVAWATFNGITMGYGNGNFGPNDYITREQIAAIMHRYAQYKGYDVSVGENTNILSYDDFHSISEYAIASMQYAAGSGLMKGKTTSTLNPLDNATRAEIAAILHRFIEVN